MTVRDLIEKLGDMPYDAEVYLHLLTIPPFPMTDVVFDQVSHKANGVILS